MQPQSSLFRRRDLGDPGAAPGTVTGGTAEQERENDALVKALLSDIKTTKSRFTKMNEEVVKHNTMLAALEKTFISARSSLADTMRRLDHIGLSSFKHMWVLFVFVIIFFMLIYLMMKFRN
ncbi:blocked early in transport 1 [Strigomonas culicis]|uniref:Blocked early in transport 1 n=1 Tax=Strigomonas culicis TaxID=28005 RepID=S9ULE6_9TRYP|nr:blocked early in transport 1 [Strigomonas culicis]EPY33830.1 blocked early in transport 1 [Strigomonas culicis]|eukprot:EPY31652.1 blocked early in transport 1 [Strigomonas culicis]